MFSDTQADTGSWRDPSGKVYCINEEIFRLVFPHGTAAFEAAWNAGVLEKMAVQKCLISSEKVSDKRVLHEAQKAEANHVLKHPTIPLITYPYEWSFGALRAAALAHLDLHLALLEEGFTLSDASAFNMQFNGTRPVHIDVLSVVPYQAGARWAGYQQFLEHFLNPLILQATLGVSGVAFFRAGLNGVSSSELARLLPKRYWCKPAFLMHVVMVALSEHRRHMPVEKKLSPLNHNRLVGLLQHLHQIVTALKPKASYGLHWAQYHDTFSYAPHEAEKKAKAVRFFIEKYRPKMLLDIGCNTGEYAELALSAGATYVAGLDSDIPSIEAAFERSRSKNLAFTPLLMDITNPSPAQGWKGCERKSFTERLRADAVMALAITHHLALGKNIPLGDIISYFTSLAPRGILEFVPKSDPYAAQLLRFREDIFESYSFESFKVCMQQHARIVNETHISESGRILVEFERSA